MQSTDYWKLFLETGAPEIYLLYNNARRLEASDASEITRIGPAGGELQG